MTKYENILSVSADSPEELRLVDVERVLDEAKEQGKHDEFCRWLLSWTLQERTRERIVLTLVNQCGVDYNLLGLEILSLCRAINHLVTSGGCSREITHLEGLYDLLMVIQEQRPFPAIEEEGR